MADYGDPPQPPAPTPITIRVVQDLPPPAPPPMDGESPQPQESSEPSNKHDEFYKYWDRFVSEEPTGRNFKAKRREALSKNIVSLDSDLEGRPSHRTRRNKDGIVTT